jgi:hypothetical protein
MLSTLPMRGLNREEDAEQQGAVGSIVHNEGPQKEGRSDTVRDQLGPFIREVGGTEGVPRPSPCSHWGRG